MLHEAGIPPSVVMSFIGHDSTAVHERYVSPGDEAQAGCLGAAGFAGLEHSRSGTLYAGISYDV
jgi:hypothetical protein